MTIGTRIKQLRQENNVTQEQLAEALGITSRAVSQWECDRTAPDIMQLPALARFFDVSTDHILGVDVKHREEEVQRILYEWHKLNNSGETEVIIEYLEKRVKEYPKEPRLLERLAHAIWGYYFIQGKADTEELKQAKAEEIITLCDRALKYYDTTDDNSSTKQLLILVYTKLGMMEKAREIVDTMPFAVCSRECLEPDLYEGKEALKRRQSTLLSFMWLMHSMLWKMYNDSLYSCEQRLEVVEFDNSLIRLVTGAEPNLYNSCLSVNARAMAANYFKLGDKEKTVEMLQAAFEYAQRYEDRPDGAHYIPCWLSELDDKREYIGRYGKETLFDDLYSFIKEEHGLAESLKGSKRFNELMKKIKQRLGVMNW